MNARVVDQPFTAALGAAVEELAPAVKRHFLQGEGVRRYRGVMRRVWRRGGVRGALAWPFLAVGSRTDNVFSQTGEDVPFELVNRVARLPDGRLSMTWERTFYFPGRTQRFVGLCVFDERRGTITDWLGGRRRLEIELIPEVESGAMRLRSGRQWWRVGGMRVRIPRWLVGRAEIREWEEAGGALGISLTVANPLLGEFFGYEGVFRECGEVDLRSGESGLALARCRPGAPLPGVGVGAGVWRVIFALVAVLGTLAYVASFARVPDVDALRSLAAAVGVASGAAWLVFGAMLLVVTGARPSIGGWVDACLRTMAVGMGVVSVGTLANLIGPTLGGGSLLAVQGAILVVSNVVMAACFVGWAGRLGLSVAKALGLWMVGLNATFLAIVFVLVRMGVFA